MIRKAFMRRSALLLLLLLATLSAFAAPLRKYSPEDLAMISRLAARMLVKNHYRGDPPDRAMSYRLYDEYVKALDPGRIYFTSADLARLEGRQI